MIDSSRPSIQIDLNEFKLHIHFKSRNKLTLHFNSPSRKFYLSLIALVVKEMKKSGKLRSIPMAEHLDLLGLLNETIGGGAGSSDKENLLHRIYTKWRDTLPNLEEAPLFKVLGRKKEEGDGGKAYSFGDLEKDGWANLFEYVGSEENVRLKFAADKIGISLDETSIIFGDSVNAEAWERFISSLKKDGNEEKEELEAAKEIIEEAVPEPSEVPLPPSKERKIFWVPPVSLGDSRCCDWDRGDSDLDNLFASRPHRGCIHWANEVSPAGKPIDCCAPLCEHERGPKTGISLRWDDRGNHHCPFQSTKNVCDRPKFDLHLQGKSSEGQTGE